MCIRDSYHPGGSLGRRLLTRVKDVMHTRNLPAVHADVPLKDAVLAISEGRLGLAVIVEQGQVRGIVTDGDLRRVLVNRVDINQALIGDIMTENPVTITPDMMLADAEKLMLEKKIKALIVVDDNYQMSGILEIFDR